jgi:hypothetical protein
VMDEGGSSAGRNGNGDEDEDAMTVNVSAGGSGGSGGDADGDVEMEGGENGGDHGLVGRLLFVIGSRVSCMWRGGQITTIIAQILAIF